MSKCFVMVFDDQAEAEAMEIDRRENGFTCALYGPHEKLDIGDARGQTTDNLLYVTDSGGLWLLVAEK